jgi:hypothetical protein
MCREFKHALPHELVGITAPKQPKRRIGEHDSAADRDGQAFESLGKHRAKLSLGLSGATL